MIRRFLKAALFYVCFFSLICTWDVLLRTRLVLGHYRARVWANQKAYHMCRVVFAVTRMYLDHKIAVTREKKVTLPEQFMLISNHQSIVDIPVLISAFPTFPLRFTAKSSLFRRVPLISPMLRIQRHAAIFRGEQRRETFKQLARLAQDHERGICPVVFPEGTRSRDGALGRFRLGGAYFIEKRSNLPIVCVTMDGGWRVSETSTLGQNLQGCRYRVHIEGVYSPVASKTEMADIVETCHRQMALRLEKWRKKSLSGIEKAFNRDEIS